jgi:pyruvate dehydrogenase E2 component (dihydrolipoamide acetyltransferase)
MQILMPKLNDAGDPGVISEIFVAVGDVLTVGERVMAVEMEKAVIEIEATAAGTVRQIAVAPGDEVQVGQLLLELE